MPLLRRNRQRSRIPVALAALVALAACFSESDPLSAPEGAACSIPVDSPVFGQEQVVVAIQGFAFRTEELRIVPGTTVTWVNCDSEGHTVTPDDGTFGAEGSEGSEGSDLLAEGATFSYTFEETGTFPYHCIPHPSMTAVVIVE